MIEGLKPYAEYKESGSKWLGEVPRHWSLRRLGASITDCANGVWGSDPNGKDDLICVRVADFDRVSHRVSLKKKTLRAIPLSARSRRLLRSGDLLLEKSGGGDLQPVGAVVSYDHDEPAVCSNFVARMPVANGYISHFVVSLHFTLYAARINVLSIKQTTGIQNLDSKAYLREVVAFPPPDEQAAIVRFLDHANRKIDGFIRAKRKLIGLLNEQKQAIIHRAVTRGLHPDVPLKPSGIPWLGDIPKHWEVRRLRTIVTKIEQGVSPQASGFLADGDSWGVLKSGCVNHGTFRQTEHKQLAKSFVIDPTIAVKVGDVLISRACGSPKLVGSVGKVTALNYKLILSDKTFRATFGPIVDSDFMVYAMNGVYYRQQVEQAISGADGMANNLPLSELKGFVFAIPPLVEAAKIASNLDAELVRFTTAIARTEREIALMQEYRTRLTADLVTGKLDVREAAAKLPDLPTDAAAPAEPLTDEAPEESETEEAEA